MTEKSGASVPHYNKSAEHLPLPNDNDAYESLHMLTVLFILAPCRLDASRCTVASRFRCHSHECGYIVRGSQNSSLPPRSAS